MWLSRGSGAPHNDDVYEAGITSCFTKDEFMLKWSVNVTFMWFVHLWVFIISLKEVVEAINECRTTPRTTGYSLTKTQRWTFKEQHLLWNIPEGCLKKSKSVQDVLKHTFGHNKCWLSFCLICWFRRACTFPIFLVKHKVTRGFSTALCKKRSTECVKQSSTCWVSHIPHSSSFGF